MDKKVRERKLIKEREDILAREIEEKNEEYKRKMQFYEDRIIDMNTKYKKEQLILRNKTANVRIKRRRGSDGLIGVTFPFEDYHEDLP
jgi:hypothetical protein